MSGSSDELWHCSHCSVAWQRRFELLSACLWRHDYHASLSKQTSGNLIFVPWELNFLSYAFASARKDGGWSSVEIFNSSVFASFFLNIKTRKLREGVLPEHSSMFSSLWSVIPLPLSHFRIISTSAWAQNNAGFGVAESTIRKAQDVHNKKAQYVCLWSLRHSPKKKEPYFCQYVRIVVWSSYCHEVDFNETLCHRAQRSRVGWG